MALRPLLAEFDIDLEMLDVDANPTLEALYDELVPVPVSYTQRDVYKRQT